MFLVWLMAAILVASVVTFVGLLVYARRTYDPALGMKVDRERTERAAMSFAEAEKIARDVVATQSTATPWNAAVPDAIQDALQSLSPEIVDLLKRQRRLAFDAEAVDLSAEYLIRPTMGPRLPTGMSQIGTTEYGEYALCARPGRRDVQLFRAEDREPDTSFDSIFHCIALLADADLGKRSRVEHHVE